MDNLEVLEKNKSDENIKLTQFSRGGGCGCKIAPNVLQEILGSSVYSIPDKNLLVGNSTNDDAAVYDLGDGTALISTTDFFMPIVDDAFSFGKIAAANAISDVYAMGGLPLMAIAILGWPIEKIQTSVAQKVLEGARSICTEANITLAGGHSIDSTEPIFGLAVTGRTNIKNIKLNSGAKEGNYLFLTKPLGTGILSTAQKRCLLKPEHYNEFISQLCSLNKIGLRLGELDYVTAMTDITGFGLLGHVIEMAEGCKTNVELFYDNIPVMEGAKEYLTQRIVPDATYRNWNSYSKKVGFEKGVNVMEAFNLLPDPQTNGGILFSCSPDKIEDVKSILNENGIVYNNFIGRFIGEGDKLVMVKNNS